MSKAPKGRPEEDDYQGGLVPYKGRAKDPLERFMSDKNLRKEVRDASCTRPASIERKRIELGIIQEIVRGNITRMRKLTNEIYTLQTGIRDGEEQPNIKDEWRSKVRGLMDEAHVLSAENTVLQQFGMLLAQSITIDCLSVAIVVPVEVKDKDTGQTVKKDRNIRISVAEMIYSQFHDDESPEMVNREDVAAMRADLNGIFMALHRGFKGMNPLAFKGRVTDELGIAVEVDDVIDAMIQRRAKAVAEAEAARAAAGESDDVRDILADEERAEIERKAREEFNG